MKNILKRNKEGLPAGRQGGFFEIIIIVIIGLLLMKYFNINVSTVINWGESFLQWFLTFFKDVLK